VFQPAVATTALLQAASLVPCFWSAWTALGALYPSAEAVAKLPIPEHWMTEFFSAHVALEAQVRFVIAVVSTFHSNYSSTTQGLQLVLSSCE